ncbi:MAG TPA: DUF305 domain-containing protein, partial [Longimicrobiales bacterium]|nr:DUF305 domain-containing protein [Longimicrobiales bacterium]
MEPVAVSRRLHGAFATISAVVVGACGGSGAGVRVGGSPSTSPSIAELEALYRARTDSALSRFTAADVDFMTRMIGHHEQALAMASLAEPNGAGPSVRALAARVANAQVDEIAIMKRWLEDRGQGVRQDPEGRAAGPRTGPAQPVASPGMLTPEQMRQLGAARGRGF